MPLGVEDHVDQLEVDHVPAPAEDQMAVEQRAFQLMEAGQSDLLLAVEEVHLLFLLGLHVVRFGRQVPAKVEFLVLAVDDWLDVEEAVAW